MVVHEEGERGAAEWAGVFVVQRANQTGFAEGVAADGSNGAAKDEEADLALDLLLDLVLNRGQDHEKIGLDDFVLGTWGQVWGRGCQRRRRRSRRRRRDERRIGGCYGGRCKDRFVRVKESVEGCIPAGSRLAIVEGIWLEVLSCIGGFFIEDIFVGGQGGSGADQRCQVLE